MTDAPLLQIQTLTQRYGTKTVLDQVSLAIPRGSFAVLLGPSGSGKTTLLNILGGFATPVSGRVLIEGRDVTTVPPARRPTATVFQDYALFPTMSVVANVGFGLRMRGVPAVERHRKAADALAMVGLPDMGRRKPHQLSGGQRQRVALARALVVEPLVLLLDEPLGALDLKLRRQMQDELKALQRRVGTTFVHVTHDQEEALAIADRIVVMNEGRIEDEGPPERVYARPASRFTALFMGDSNILGGRVLTQVADRLTVETELGTFTLASPGTVMTPAIAVRPEHIITTRLPDHAPQVQGTGTITEMTFLGAHIRARVMLPSGTPVTVNLADGSGLAPGVRVGLYVDPARLTVLAR